MSQFEQKAAKARRIELGEESYGDGAPSEQALKFYLDEMLDEAVGRARARSDHLPAQPVGPADQSVRFLAVDHNPGV